MKACSDKYEMMHIDFAIFQSSAEQFEMFDGELKSVLRCGECNKPFDKRKTSTKLKMKSG